MYHQGISACLHGASACASSVGYLYAYISAWASALLVLNTMGIAKAFYFAERVMITDSHAESYTIP